MTNLWAEGHADERHASKSRRQYLDNTIAEDGAKHRCPKGEPGLQPYTDIDRQLYYRRINVSGRYSPRYTLEALTRDPRTRPTRTARTVRGFGSAGTPTSGGRGLKMSVISISPSESRSILTSSSEVLTRPTFSVGRASLSAAGDCAWSWYCGGEPPAAVSVTFSPTADIAMRRLEDPGCRLSGRRNAAAPGSTEQREWRRFEVSQLASLRPRLCSRQSGSEHLTDI